MARSCTLSCYCVVDERPTYAPVLVCVMNAAVISWRLGDGCAPGLRFSLSPLPPVCKWVLNGVLFVSWRTVFPLCRVLRRAWLYVMIFYTWRCHGAIYVHMRHARDDYCEA